MVCMFHKDAHCTVLVTNRETAQYYENGGTVFVLYLCH